MNIISNSEAKLNKEIVYNPKENISSEIYLQAPSNKNNSNVDKAIISDEARKLMADNENSDISSKTLNESKEILKDLKELSTQKNDVYGVYIKCLQISSRIINGDNVPAEDIQFLAEKEPKLFTDSILLRQEKRNPKDYDSLLEDEDLVSTDENIPLESLEDLNIDISVDSEWKYIYC